jgi:hypothetical protein
MDKPVFLFYNFDAAASVTATDSQAGRDPEDVLYSSEDTYWKPLNVTGSKELVIDRNESTFHNTIALLGIALDGVSLEVRTSTDNFVSSDNLLFSRVLDSNINATWVPHSGCECQYIKLIFTNFDTDFAVSFVCPADAIRLPYLEKDFDPDNIVATGDHLVSSSGMYIGFNLQKSMSEMTISVGEVSPEEYNELFVWRDECVKRMLPFFFVPDAKENAIYFGWLPDKKFSAPLVDGMRVVGDIRFITRAL